MKKECTFSLNLLKIPCILDRTLFFRIFYVFISILYERQRGGHRQRDSSSTGSNPKCLQQTGLAQAKARSLKLNPSSPCREQGPRYFSHHLPPPRVCINSKLDQKYLLWEAGVPSNDLAIAPNAFSVGTSWFPTSTHVIYLTCPYNSPKVRKIASTPQENCSWRRSHS